MAGVLVFGDASGGMLSESSLEVAAAGRKVAEALGVDLVGGLIGAEIGSAAEAFLAGGMQQLYVVDDARHEPYSGDRYVVAAEAVVRACDPSVVLIPHDLDTREWAPRLAARLDAGLITDCSMLSVDGGELVLTKPVYGGSVFAEYLVGANVTMATIRPGAYEPVTVDAVGSVVQLDTPATDPRVTILEEIVDAVTEGPQLRDAKVVVSGGLGVGGPENWHLVEDLAATLGAAVGATRAVTDLGWVPSHHQVGLTGTSIAPDLYVAIGVSGAIQHMAGISQAKTIVAINRDPEAYIFTAAGFGAIGDAREIVPPFIDRIKQLTS